MKKSIVAVLIVIVVLGALALFYTRRARVASDRAIEGTTTGTEGSASPTSHRGTEVRHGRDLRFSCLDCNVVLITVDTLRADHLPCYGYDRDTTPRICGVGEHGILFENAYSQAPRTQPALASILSGELIANESLMEIIAYMNTQESLGQALGKRGYLTAGFTDHPALRPTLAHASVLTRGFETFINKGEDIHSVTSQKMSDALISWLEANRKRKFFLWAHFFDPHFNYVPPADWESRFGFSRKSCGRVRNPMDIEEIRRIMEELTERELECIVALHQAEIAYTDYHIGLVLDAIESLGLRRRTLVIITSDHGEEFMERGYIGHERTVFNELIRVPLLISPPSMDQSVRMDTPIATKNIFSIVLSSVAGEQARIADGSVYSRAFHYFGDKQESLSKIDSHPNEFAIIDGSDKFILTQGVGRPKYYNLAIDPEERYSNLNSPRSAELKRRLEAWMDENTITGALPAVNTKHSLVEELDRLKNLGYVR